MPTLKVDLDLAHVVLTACRHNFGVVPCADTVARLGDSRFAICLAPVRQLDLELCIQLAGRLQATVEEPIPVDGTGLYVTACVGFCPRNRAPSGGAQAWQTAALTALT